MEKTPVPISSDFFIRASIYSFVISRARQNYYLPLWIADVDFLPCLLTLCHITDMIRHHRPQCRSDPAALFDFQGGGHTTLLTVYVR